MIFWGSWGGGVCEKVNRQPTNLKYKRTYGHYGDCRTVKVTDTEPYYIRAVPATKAFILC